MLIAKNKEHILNSDLTVENSSKSEAEEDTIMDIYEGSYCKSKPYKEEVKRNN